MKAGSDWQLIDMTRSIDSCGVSAASTKDAQGISWVHVYLVWEWLAVHVTVSREGDPLDCSSVWESVFSIRPTVQ